MLQIQRLEALVEPMGLDRQVADPAALNMAANTEALVIPMGSTAR